MTDKATLEQVKADLEVLQRAAQGRNFTTPEQFQRVIDRISPPVPPEEPKKEEEPAEKPKDEAPKEASKGVTGVTTSSKK